MKDESDACFPALFESHVGQSFLAGAVVPGSEASGISNIINASLFIEYLTSVTSPSYSQSQEAGDEPGFR